MRKNNDILWKAILEEVFDDFLRFVFPQAAVHFDLERGFEFMDKELAEMYPEPEKKTTTRFVDKLVKVFRRDGQEEWVLVHVEVQEQTTKRPPFAERMFRYFIRLIDRYEKPVTAVAVFSGTDSKNMPNRYLYDFMGTRFEYEFNTLSILNYPEDELESSNNPFALVVQAAKASLMEGKIPDLELLERKVLIANELSEKGFSDQKMKAIFSFLESYVRFEDPDMSRIFKERISHSEKNREFMGIEEAIKYIAREEGREEGLEKGLEEGLEKGLEKGIEEGRREAQKKAVKSLLDNTEFSADKIASILDLPLSFVEQVKKEI